MEKLFAFWEYEHFPFVLGSGVEKIVMGGYVKAEGYGGRCFKPLIILPYDEGKKIEDELNKLSCEYREETKKLHNDFVEKTNKIFFDAYELITYYKRIRK